ncbi:MAG: FhaA domain-containing protein [Chloroflexota bacterium]
MATVYSNRTPENDSEGKALAYLKEHLPDDFVLVPNVRLADTNRVPEIDLVIIKENAIITAEIKGWYGHITGSAFGDTVQAGRMVRRQRNPVRQADIQAKSLATYLRQPKPAETIFGDARIGYCIYIIPIVIFTHPEADIAIQSQEAVRLLHLEEVVECITHPDFRGTRCRITPPERKRLAALLLNEPIPELTEASAIPAAVEPMRQSDDEATQPNSPSSGEVKSATELAATRDGVSTDTTPPTDKSQPPNRLDEATAQPLAAFEANDAALTPLNPSDEIKSIPEAEVHSDVDLSPTFIYIPPTPADDPPTSDLSAYGRVPKKARRKQLPPQRPWAVTLKQWGQTIWGQVDTLEKWVEQGENRVLRGKQSTQTLKPAQLARALEQELEQTLHYVIDEIIAHNQFTISLSPKDYTNRLSYKERLEQKLVRYIQELIEARDYQILGTIQVEIVEDVELSPNRCTIHSRLEEGVSATESTPYLELLPTGDRYPLGSKVVTIGRSQQNDICLGALDQRRVISRRHAHIKQEKGDTFVLYDGLSGQHSTAGTYLAGQRLNGKGQPLQDGQSIILGPTQRLNPTQPLQGSMMFVFHTGE